ncbi:HalOD1 output domain-containing protein [Natronoarchaeum mannanilyticum]|uniref:Halobacterial output domain-containing protein n=1 Tax=Natronoarchaeum mannanilyticum TaxID=926360 RepID=A0AAV3TCC2_9EURY
MYYHRTGSVTDQYWRDPVPMRNTDYHDGRDERRSDAHRFEWSDDAALSITVIEAVASVSGRDPIDIEPLNRYVDPDALDEIFDRGDAATSARGRISFPLEEYLVVVYSDGDILVYPPE